MRRISSILLAVIISLLFVACSSRENLNDMFDSFEIETAQEVPYVCYNTLIFNDMSLNFNELLDNIGISGIFHEVYVIQNDVIWFGYSEIERTENGAKKWNIASVSIDGTNFNITYSGEFCIGNEADQSYAQNNNAHTNERYLTANGFYYDGRIILTDHVKTIEFDLATTSSKEVSVVNYKYPTLSFEAQIMDYQTISFYKNSEQKIFNVETGAQTSETFKKLLELEKEKNWQGKSYLSELFDKVQIVNNQIYIICRVINWAGETHAIVFQYDFENNSCKYAFHCFVDDVISNNLYIVPMI